MQLYGPEGPPPPKTHSCRAFSSFDLTQISTSLRPACARHYTSLNADKGLSVFYASCRLISLLPFSAFSAC